MKKIFTFLLVIVLICTTLSACESSEKEAQFTTAQEVYFGLIDASDMCIKMMDTIYEAWYFAIYEADDYSPAGSGWYDAVKAFCSSTGLGYEKGKQLLNQYAKQLGLNGTSDIIEWYTIISNFSYAVDVVLLYYQENNYISKTESKLTHSKELLKSMTDEYADYTEYPTLKELYSEVSAYFEFCSNPTGSFAQLKTTIESYETNIRKYKNDLSFVFED